jgi:chorismate dehydratase
MLRLGKVGYLNALPLFYALKGFEIVEGHPADLVKMLRSGQIEGGIVSSVEYFFNPEDYLVLPGISISSRGRVCSVLLLSRKPLRDIRRVRITPRSLTSRYLLNYILKRVYGTSPEEVARGEEAVLVIGDEALRRRRDFPYAYDLGEEWFRATGLPFVFALFLVRREVPEDQVLRIYRGVRESLRRFREDLLSRRFRVPPDFPHRYFSECIDYGLGEEHLESLRTFFAFMEEETGRPAPRIIFPFRP